MRMKAKKYAMSPIWMWQPWSVKSTRDSDWTNRTLISSMTASAQSKSSSLFVIKNFSHVTFYAKSVDDEMTSPFCNICCISVSWISQWRSTTWPICARSRSSTEGWRKRPWWKEEINHLIYRNVNATINNNNYRVTWYSSALLRRLSIDTTLWPWTKHKTTINLPKILLE